MPSLGDLFKTMDIVTKAVLEAALKEFPCKNKSEKHCSHCPFGLTCDAVQMLKGMCTCGNPKMGFPCCRPWTASDCCARWKMHDEMRRLFERREVS